uniref:Putative defensin 1 n=1 Tax=Nyssomyia neivai TaxID=330878 RepID=A0A1L8E2S2_9DIPT
MNFFRISIIVAILIVAIAADPAKKKSESFNQVEEIPEESEVQPRVTCDLLGPTGWGDALCAAHCIAKGYKGGYCDSRKVCNCR